MLKLHKIIKYCAITLAIFIIVSIVICALKIIGAFAFFTGSDEARMTEYSTIEIKNADTVKSLYIDIGSARLDVSTGDDFSLSTNNKYISCTNSNGKLRITEDSFRVFPISSVGNDTYVKLTVPTDFEFKNIEISTGAGDISISELRTETLDLELGAGRVTFDELYVDKEADIEGGAGELKISSGEICGLDFDMGVGKTTLCLSLIGRNQINMGIGDLNVSLLGEKDDYTVDIDKGIGDVNIDGSSIKNGNIVGNGSNIIEIDGGIGAIDIKFENKN